MGKLNIAALQQTDRPVRAIADRLAPYLQILVDEFHPEKVILFGSYAYGQPNEHSDIDLLVIKPLQSSTLKEALAIRKKWRALMRQRDRLSIELLIQSPEQHQDRLTNNAGFYSEITTKGFELV